MLEHPNEGKYSQILHLQFSPNSRLQFFLFSFFLLLKLIFNLVLLSLPHQFCLPPSCHHHASHLVVKYFSLPFLSIFPLVLCAFTTMHWYLREIYHDYSLFSFLAKGFGQCGRFQMSFFLERFSRNRLQKQFM